MRLFPPLLVMLLFSIPSLAQLDGIWIGELSQTGLHTPYSYRMKISQNGKGIAGVGISVQTQTGDSAIFNLAGYLEGNKLVWQEVEQLYPATPKWCLKHANLTWSNNTLQGDWTAQGCNPGALTLQRIPSSTPEQNMAVAPTQSSSFPIGTWKGYLLQGDTRVFEATLELGEKSTYRCMLRDQSGQQSGELEGVWSYDESLQVIRFRDEKVLGFRPSDKPFCLKKGQLQLQKQAQNWIAKGDWEGYLDGFQGQKAGVCTPGTLELTQLLPPEKTVEAAAPNDEHVFPNNFRKVNLEHEISITTGGQTYLQVWDSGLTDDDAVTIFLNGERIAYRQRVSKRRISFPVTLKEDVNFIVLYADDVGKLAPNTVTVALPTPTEEKMVIVRSDLNESGAILVRKIELK